ncbi:MAG: glycosyltransferase family 4 protein [Bacteroidota bacterium]|nr:glycosyltransferase family 4 protein [Bacteroidota bacterium]
MNKVLIITYYWPPFGGSGVQRWLKFAKYLPKYGWKPIIYTPENPYFEVKDPELLKEIPEEVEIWKTTIWEPYTLKDKLLGKGSQNQSAGVISKKSLIKNKILNWVRGNVFIPDPKVYWVKPSIKVLHQRIKKEGINYIITTGPPHSMHLIGLGLKKKIPSLKWIADFRDPWSELDLLDEFSLSNLSRVKHQKLEKKVLKNANMVLTVSESWTKDLKRLGGDNVELITNGYDEVDFLLKAKTNDKFIIGHYGLLNHLRNPKNLWKTLDLLCREDNQLSSKLEIHLSGNIDEEVLLDIESFPMLKGKVKLLGYLSHTEVLARYNETDILLLLLFNSKSGVGNYPGKIFEYFASQKPILAFGPSGSDTERLIKRTNTGLFFTYEESELRSSVLDLYNQRLKFEYNDVLQFSRLYLTDRLSKLLNKL